MIYIVPRIPRVIHGIATKEADSIPIQASAGKIYFSRMRTPLSAKVGNLLIIKIPTIVTQAAIRYGLSIRLPSISKDAIIGKRERPAPAGAGTPEKNLFAHGLKSFAPRPALNLASRKAEHTVNIRQAIQPSDFASLRTQR